MSERGMITVEVSVIVPMLFFMIAMLLFFFLFLVDISAFKSESMRAALEASAVWKNRAVPATGRYSLAKLLEEDQDDLTLRDRESEEAAKKRLEKRLGERKILTGTSHTDVRISGSVAAASGKISIRLPLSGISAYFGKRGWAFSCRARAALDDWEESLRKESMQWNGE